jgi:hypothetical protein
LKVERIASFILQAILKQVMTLGLKNLYDHDFNVRQQVRQLMALSFAPVPVIINTCRYVLQPAAHPALQPLLHYYEQQWLQPSLLPMWNTYQTSRRTNNELEGWHNGFANLINKDKMKYLLGKGPVMATNSPP